MVPAQQSEGSKDGGLSPSSSLLTESVDHVELERIPSSSQTDSGCSCSAPLPTGPAKSWTNTVGKIIPAVVALKVASVRTFDTNTAGCSVATGFVVDKENGLLLTNRHVIGPGPEVSEAIFHDHEEVPVQAVYVDPLHDFGFFRFDPKRVHFMNVVEIPLAPERAKVGVDIRVVGNDAGEKLSILAGTLARLDREAPQYSGYTDFNTFYYQAASSTSGGSSGSPVIDIDGYAIALNAGGRKKAASSFYFPLDRVIRALGYVRKGLPVPRGTIQTVFRYQPFDEVKRLGLTAEAEKDVRTRFPTAFGMLVVCQTVPSGPGHLKLRPGDILYRVNGQPLNTFVALETVLDDSVGRDVEMEIQRGGVTHVLKLQVQDLHSITPSSFLEFADGIFHDLSYQQARNYLVPCKGVYVAQAGYMLRNAQLSKNIVILSLGTTPTPTLKDFKQTLLSIADGSKVAVRYISLSDRHREQTGVITVEWRFHRAMEYQRSSTFGVWDIAQISPPAIPEPKTLYGETHLRYHTTSKPAAMVAQSLALVDFNIPHCISGVAGNRYQGCGVVLDTARGLMLVDRNTIPIAYGSITVSFGGAVDIPAEVLFLHPVHNFGIIKYDPRHIGTTPVKAISLAADEVRQGDEVYLVGLTRGHQLVSRKCTVTKIEPLSINEMSPPRFRAVNTNVIHLDNVFTCQGGIIVAENGNMLGLYASYSYQSKGENYGMDTGMPIGYVSDVLNDLKDDQVPDVRVIDAELGHTRLAQAKAQGLPDDWLIKLEELAFKTRPHLLSVRRLTADSQASKVLKEGDIILAVEGKPVTEFLDFERAHRQRHSVEITLLRDGQVCTLTVPTDRLPGTGDVARVLCWAGALLHEPARPVLQQAFAPSRIYCSWWSHGSPADKYGLQATVFITEVNGREVTSLDDFLEAVKSVKEDEFIRLRTVNLNTKDKMLTLRPDYHFWPTWALTRHPVTGRVQFEEMSSIHPNHSA